MVSERRFSVTRQSVSPRYWTTSARIGAFPSPEILFMFLYFMYNEAEVTRDQMTPLPS